MSLGHCGNGCEISGGCYNTGCWCWGYGKCRPRWIPELLTIGILRMRRRIYDFENTNKMHVSKLLAED